MVFLVYALDRKVSLAQSYDWVWNARSANI